MPCVNTSGGNKLIEGYNTTMALPVFHEKHNANCPKDAWDSQQNLEISTERAEHDADNLHKKQTHKKQTHTTKSTSAQHGVLHKPTLSSLSPFPSFACWGNPKTWKP